MWSETNESGKSQKSRLLVYLGQYNRLNKMYLTIIGGSENEGRAYRCGNVAFLCKSQLY